MIIFVTGVYGFLGRHVAKRFADAGWQVIGFGRGAWQHDEYRSWGISVWHEGDISLSLLSNTALVPDVIAHCAGGGSVANSVSKPYQDFLQTVDGTAAVLEFARLHAPEAHLIYPSSPAVQGVHDESAIRTTDPRAPVSPYGFHKKMAEDMCTSYRHAYGSFTTVIRFFSVYGAGLRKQLLWDACKKIAAADDVAVFWGTGNETRDWVHVSDAANLVFMLASVSREVLPSVLNCGSGVPHTIAEILKSLSDLAGSKARIAFNGAARAGDPKYYLADITDALHLGWRPLVSLEDGLREYVDWFWSVND